VEVTSTFSADCDGLVEGSWSYTASIDLGVPCTITETLSLSQSQGTFGGTAKNGRLRCPLADFDEILPDALVRSGVSDHDRVEFFFDDWRVHHTGVYAGSGMRGDVVFHFPEGDVTGSWSASRTSEPILDRQSMAGEVAGDGPSSFGELLDRLQSVAGGAQ
jgi:hypothetical protein